jgi:hypothetical protein
MQTTKTKFSKQAVGRQQNLASKPSADTADNKVPQPSADNKV